ncbi:MAG: hypothetical protein KC493_04060 [Bacteriovoracaceae bacterium]|nr:hypothetical protein [Bacteriovoracaceae bacterium]
MSKIKTHIYLGIPLFVLLSGFFTWLLNYSFKIDTSISLMAMSLVPAIYFFFNSSHKNIKSFYNDFLNAIPEGCTSVVVFLGLFTITSFHLGIATGEKPMDFGILNYFYLHESGQPTDVWASGSPFSYYYLGFFIWAKWLKLLSIDPGIGYALAFALNGWLLFLGCFSFFKIIGNKKSSDSIFLSLFVFLIPSFSTILALFNGVPWNFSTFWSATRVFKENLFAEFPLWSLLFGDLHPHVMNYPFFVSFLTLVLSYGFFQNINLLNLFFVVLSGAALSLVNIWEGIFLIVIVIYFWIYSFFAGPKIDRYRRFILNPILSGLTGMILILPWVGNILKNGSSAGTFSLSTAPANGIKEYFMFYGVLLFLWIISFVIDVYKNKIIFSFKTIKINFFFFIPLIGLLVIGLFNSQKEIYLLMGLVLSLYIISLLQSNKDQKQIYILTGILGMSGISLFFLSENLIILDRINSLFKTNTFLFTITSLGVAILFLNSLKTLLGEKRGVYLFRGLVLILLVPACLLFVGIRSITGNPSKVFGTPLSHMENIFEGDAKIIHWLKLNGLINNKIVEYYGSPYKYQSARISTYTGIPSYLGWAGQHVTQRGLKHQEMAFRKRTIEKIYRDIESDEVYRLLKNEKIDYVVVGQYEKIKIGGPGLEKFDKSPDKFQKVVHHLPTGARLYKVK